MKVIGRSKPGFGLLLACCALLPLAAWSQTARYVFPSQTDPGISNFNNACYISINTAAPSRQQLFLFLPGTGGIPAGYTNIVATAANLGFNAIGLMYDNSVTVNSLCDDDTNPACFQEIREDIIEGGTNAEPAFSVSREESIENRLVKMIQYLAGRFPSENWGQFLDAQTNINWPQIVISGHSQGAGHAGLIAKLHPVARTVMFSDTDWWAPGNRPADWIFAPGFTPEDLYFGFVHRQDPLVLYSSYEIPTWDAFGMNVFGGPLLVESNAPPYFGSHMLTTDLPTQNNQIGLAYHNAVALDSATPFQTNGIPVYLPVWQWMMTGPPLLPVLGISLQGTNIGVTFTTLAGYDYQLQDSTVAASIWSNTIPSISGNGSTNSVLLTPRSVQRFYRVTVN
jgi:hypothetical protein